MLILESTSLDTKELKSPPFGPPAAIGDEMKVNNHPRLSCLKK
jgi:hypothetical protein